MTSNTPTPTKRLLMIITGSIAAYKSLDILRQIREQGIAVTCILTEGAKQFVTPLSCAALSGNPVYDNLFSLKDESEMGHIRLAREHDLILVAPASADMLAKMAEGRADDLATAILLATDTRVAVAPAMNVKMWEHPATRRNVRQLHSDGITFIGPDRGSLACGEEGEGRMAPVEQIVNTTLAMLGHHGARRGLPLAGKTALVTAGPTRETLDPVRFLSNFSSGKQGYALAEALRDAGADVTLISGPTHLPAPSGITLQLVETAEAMLKACEAALPVDVAICAAAVADWRPKAPAENKQKKSRAKTMQLTLVQNPDILKILSNKRSRRPKLVIGFAAETDNLLEHARKKRKQKNCDWILANDVSENVFGSDTNKVVFIPDNLQEEEWGETSKHEIAARLTARIIRHIAPSKVNTKLTAVG
ncbi:MAG: bifunctional phosphopantothenoylcysteine decarboxylase/phosphopantothenate--cysteine ligase CoaBC [Rickettsiales bacterium]|nr:bifunctional phosphopantothenoylcysteine decarboxylase/phosphopantothenate--cysteine ligase CoaBC [Rickettsiales bacterium]